MKVGELVCTAHRQNGSKLAATVAAAALLPVMAKIGASAWRCKKPGQAKPWPCPPSQGSVARARRQVPVLKYRTRWVLESSVPLLQQSEILWLLMM